MRNFSKRVMAPNCLNSIYTISVYMLEFILILSLLQQIIPASASPRRKTQGQAIGEPFDMKKFDFDWQQASWDNLRLWRWRNRNRGRNNVGGGQKKGKKLAGQRVELDLFMKPRLGKRGGGGHLGKPVEGGSRLTLSEKFDTYLTQDILESCCPTVKELVSPASGRNSSGHLVELYQDDRINQKFYEVSCRPDVNKKPCKFLENRHSKSSVCKQQHTLTYALVRPLQNKTTEDEDANSQNETDNGHFYNTLASQDLYEPKPQQKSVGYVGNIFAVMMSNGAVIKEPWYLDYITIRSGCSCHVDRNKTRKRKALLI